MSVVISNSLPIFNFKTTSDISGWKVVNDVVMGGKSNGIFYLNETGNGVFEGIVSLENNGGFSYLRYQLNKLDVTKFKKIKIRLKGDGKKYQFRVKTSKFSQESYITYFQTSGDWQTVEIELSKLAPFYRGSKLNLPNFSGEYLEELGFLIGNKKFESFHLVLDRISLE
jgi:hypothetical protein